jgi:hypothetical protein
MSPSIMHLRVSLRFLRYVLIGTATPSTVVADGSSKSRTCKLPNEMAGAAAEAGDAAEP